MRQYLLNARVRFFMLILLFVMIIARTLQVQAARASKPHHSILSEPAISFFA